MDASSRPPLLARLCGWFAVTLSVLAACFWAFWGTLENFHEGWWHARLGDNLLLTGAYLGPATAVVVLALLAVRWPRVGGAIHVLLGLALLAWWWGQMRGASLIHHLTHMVTVTSEAVVALGILYVFGRARPRRLAMILLVALPALVAVACAIEPVWRISQRSGKAVDSSVVVRGNGVELLWAPPGPGWPKKGNVDFAEAQRIVAHLTADGQSCAETPQNIWRLPTVAEVVGSLTRRGHNAGGRWDAAAGTATYTVMPDKEPPLWHMDSPVIYWWTSSSVGSRVYIVVFNGRVSPRTPAGTGSTAFRAVREVAPADAPGATAPARP